MRQMNVAYAGAIVFTLLGGLLRSLPDYFEYLARSGSRL